MKLALRVLPALVLGVLAVAGCTNQKLVPVTSGPPPVVDDLLEVDADFCTREAKNEIFPVKILLVVDASGSMQFTDQPGLRVNAILQLINSLKTQRDVFVSTLAFGSNVYQRPDVTSASAATFEPVDQWQEPPFLTLKDVTTDYQGALEAVKQTLLQDMLQQDAGTLSRTKYVVLFFSDGAPNPACCIQADAQVGQIQHAFGCAPEGWEVPDPNTIYCDGFPENNICLQSAALDNFRSGVQGVVGGTGQPDYGNGVADAVAGLKIGANYNRIFQIEQQMRDVVKLGEDFGVGDLQFNTALLDDDTLSDVVKQTFQLNSCQERGLLQDMANIGHGQFRDFSNSESIDFLSFDFTSLKQNFSLIDAFAVNKNALPPGGDPRVVDYRADSDGDGIDDDTEFQLGTDPAVKDSDKQVSPVSVNQVPVVLDDPNTWGDGYDDNFEEQRANIGFDPRYQSLPVRGCPRFDQPHDPGVPDTFDTDGDALNDCEEAILGTDPLNPDTDGDTLPDGLEERIGLDPLIAEGNRDDDFDGTPNIEELRKGRDPHVPDSNREQTSIRYELIENGHTEDGRTCYTSIARGIHLASTQPRFLAEAPQGDSKRVAMRVACVRVQYIKPSFKDPVQGIVHLQDSDFKPLDDETVIGDINNNRGDYLCGGLEVQ